MDREWLRDFYRECGRELSLSYDVINQTNYWGLTVVTAVIVFTIVTSVDTETFKINYPMLPQWYIITFAWIIMLRFFVRSSLGLVNMHRWNILSRVISRFLSIPEDHPQAQIFKNNCIQMLDAYYYRWKSPRRLRKIVWDGLKLMYLWFVIAILSLYVWGLIVLPKDNLFWVFGLVLFLIPTSIEIYWMKNYSGFEYEALDEIEDPNITQIWKEPMKKNE
ncbi:MAG: hypothetical protein SVM80_06890 [Halobacteriota archaeon]|nr:hypothetical protein [Halobacteriota archaeon]